MLKDLKLITLDQWLIAQWRHLDKNNVLPSMNLANGCTFSLQASKGHHCKPVADLADPLDYTHFEVYVRLLDSEVFTWFLPFTSETTYDDKYICCNVPKSIVCKVIEACGGIVN